MPGCIACPGWNGIIIGPPCIPPIIPPCMPPIGMCPVEKIDGLSGSRFLGVRVFLLMATSLRPSRALSRSFIQQQRRATSRTLLFGRLWEIRMYRCTLSEHLSTLYLVMACSSFACSSWLHSVRYRSSASLFLPFLSPFAGMAGPLPTPENDAQAAMYLHTRPRARGHRRGARGTMGASACAPLSASPVERARAAPEPREITGDVGRAFFSSPSVNAIYGHLVRTPA
mmetsp:Transcript_69676/g.220635  ORF Transcript_69676/g.220635 Transcript_69676/m.220635 type:complete len:227 (+) Transcript_69676:657-1337(+)